MSEPSLSASDSLLDAVMRTADSIVGEERLRELLRDGRQLRIKYGVDCTAPHLHLGHGVNLWMMRRFQDAGHKVVFLLGDLTTRIGDPSGRDEARPALAPEVIDANAAAFLEQASLVLDTREEVFEVRRNSEWYNQMPVSRLLELFALTTQAQLMARDMFQQRQASGREIALHELVYPVLQGFDSVAIESDLTIVGSDQLFNELMGRQYQQRLGQQPQTVITSVITPGLDGGAKQSKSLGNYIALTDTPRDKFGKVMTLIDPLVETWATVYTDEPQEVVAQLADASKLGGAAARDAKLDLAEAIVARHHGADEARRCRDDFQATFSRGELPGEIDVLEVDNKHIPLLDAVCAARPELSRSAARRLLEQGGARIDDGVVSDPDAVVDATTSPLLRTGRRHWVRIRYTPQPNASEGF